MPKYRLWLLIQREYLEEFAKFYLENIVFCQLLKDMLSKKRVYL
jgi:hypothetical protein